MTDPPANRGNKEDVTKTWRERDPAEHLVVKATRPRPMQRMQIAPIFSYRLRPISWIYVDS
jgi:hypothetical protein